MDLKNQVRNVRITLRNVGYHERNGGFLFVIFGCCAMEISSVLWFKRNMLKIGIVIVGVFLFFILLGWDHVSVAVAHERTWELPAPGTVIVQTTPTTDVTETALNKKKLELDAEKDKSDLFWAWTSSGTIVVGIAGIVFSFFQFWTAQLGRRIEQAKKDEEQFHSLIRDLGNDKVVVRIDATITLRNFLRPGYERFYQQIFDWMVRNLRERDVKNVDEPLDSLSEELITTFSASFPLARSSLQQARRSIWFNPALLEELITTFSASFPLTRSSLQQARRSIWFNPALLNASRVRLDKAYLSQSDLRGIGMPNASLKKADLSTTLLSGSYLYGTDFSQANLMGAKLSRAKLSRANLSRADLGGADLSRADLGGADLSGADLGGAKLSGADLGGAKLSRAKLSKANLVGADLSEADLSEANLSGAKLNEAILLGAHPDLAASLKNTDLRGAKGLTKEQRDACKAKEAIVD